MTYQRVADVLSDAANLIKDAGWTQFQLQSPTGEHCAVGAIQEVAASDTKLFDETVSHFERHLRFLEAEEPPQQPVVRGDLATFWNDFTCTSAKECQDMLVMSAVFVLLTPKEDA